MKTAWIAAIGVAAFGTGSAAWAAPEGQQVARERGCMECHATDKEVWGPSFRQIGKYYRTAARGEAVVVQKILKGGAEHWGDREMPAQATRPVQVSQGDAQKIARWILTLK